METVKKCPISIFFKKLLFLFSKTLWIVPILISLRKQVYMKRSITKKQEQALQLCHQDFGGLEQIEAAERMNISQQAISKLLAVVKKVLPQYFPIITKLEAQIYHYYMVEG